MASIAKMYELIAGRVATGEPFTEIEDKAYAHLAIQLDEYSKEEIFGELIDNYANESVMLAHLFSAVYTASPHMSKLHTLVEFDLLQYLQPEQLIETLWLLKKSYGYVLFYDNEERSIVAACKKTGNYEPLWVMLEVVGAEVGRSVNRALSELVEQKCGVDPIKELLSRFKATGLKDRVNVPANKYNLYHHEYLTELVEVLQHCQNLGIRLMGDTVKLSKRLHLATEASREELHKFLKQSHDPRTYTPELAANPHFHSIITEEAENQNIDFLVATANIVGIAGMCKPMLEHSSRENFLTWVKRAYSESERTLRLVQLDYQTLYQQVPTGAFNWLKLADGKDFLAEVLKKENLTAEEHILLLTLISSEGQETVTTKELVHLAKSTS